MQETLQQPADTGERPRECQNAFTRDVSSRSMPNSGKADTIHIDVAIQMDAALLVYGDDLFGSVMVHDPQPAFAYADCHPVLGRLTSGPAIAGVNFPTGAF